MKGGEIMEPEVQEAINREAEVHQPNRPPDVLSSWIGKPVSFADPWGKLHEAFITYCFSVGEDDEPMCINVVFVSQDAAKTDQYGRQVERYTSVMRRGEFSTHGMWFVMPEKLLTAG
jgi:hypothetical protein